MPLMFSRAFLRPRERRLLRLLLLLRLLWFSDHVQDRLSRSLDI
jgi:hypothetical protein